MAWDNLIKELSDYKLIQNETEYPINTTFLNKNASKYLNLTYTCNLVNEITKVEEPKLLNWTFEEVGQRTLKLKLKFSNPLYVSAYESDFLDI